MSKYAMTFSQFRYIPAFHYNKIFFCKQCKRGWPVYLLSLHGKHIPWWKDWVYWLTPENLWQTLCRSKWLHSYEDFFADKNKRAHDCQTDLCVAADHRVRLAVIHRF